MKLFVQSIHWPVALIIPAVLAVSASVQAEPVVPPGIESFCGDLLQNGSYLFDPGDLATLDALNKRLRETKAQRRREATAEERAKLTADAATAAKELLAWLEKTPKALRVQVEDHRLKPSQGGSVTLPGDAGAILLRVHRDGEDSHFLSIKQDLSVNADADGVIDVNLEPTGTTWVLLSLTNVPVKRSTLLLGFARDSKNLRLPIDVRAPEFGRFKATILSSNGDKPTPAMVRLIWKTLGSERTPGNAIEFAPQFDNQGTPSGRRRVRIPGIRGEAYWCVPGPIDMEIPPGEWEIKILRGAEHAPVTDTFSIKSGELVEKTYTPRRWVDMTRLGWYSGDDHVHCRITSDDDARRLMSWVQAEDIHVANIVKMGDINRTWFEQRGWGKAYRVIAGDVILSPGQECPRTHNQLGHTLSMNTKSMVRDTDRYYIYEEVADTVHAQGGLWGYAHVVSKMFHVDRDMSINIPKKKVDFVELMQFADLNTDLYYDFLNLGFKVTASAGSDVPWGGSVGEVRLYAYTGEGPFTADAWFTAVGKGRTFTTDGPMLTLQVDDALPGDEIVVKESRKLHVKAHAWGDPARASGLNLEIVRLGEVIKTAGSTEGKDRDVSLDFELDAGDGFWLAARVRDGEGAAAHTTPVYVQREGLRFWKHDEVDALLAKRLKSLDEVVQIVGDAKQRNDAGALDADRTRQQLALQGSDLLQRVEAARKIYADLKQVAERERSVRSAGK